MAFPSRETNRGRLGEEELASLGFSRQQGGLRRRPASSEAAIWLALL